MKVASLSPASLKTQAIVQVTFGPTVFVEANHEPAVKPKGEFGCSNESVLDFVVHLDFENIVAEKPTIERWKNLGPGGFEIVCDHMRVNFQCPAPERSVSPFQSNGLSFSLRPRGG
jgi:hypothetical protein